MIFLRDLKPVGPDESKIDQQENQKNYKPVAAGHRTPIQLALGEKSQLKIFRHSHAWLQTKRTRAWGRARARSITKKKHHPPPPRTPPTHYTHASPPRPAPPPPAPPPHTRS